MMSASIRFTYFILFAVLAGVLVLSSGCLSEPPSTPVPAGSPMENLTFYTEQLPPYNYVENGTLKGFTVDLLEAVTAKMGTKIPREKVQVTPWEEGYQAALTGNRTVLFAMARVPARENSFKWAGPISTERYVFFANRDSMITIKSPDDLRGSRIGVIADDAAVQQLLDIGVDQDQIVTENNVSALITKLENKEIDLCATLSSRAGTLLSW